MRPCEVERKVFEDNWDRIFKRKCEECGGTGIVYWYVGLDLEEEAEECDVCKGSGKYD